MSGIITNLCLMDTVKKDLSALTKLITSGGGLNKLNLAGCKVPLDGLREFMKYVQYIYNHKRQYLMSFLGLYSATSTCKIST